MAVLGDVKERIFNAAAELTDAGQRAAFLDAACRGDARLRAEIEELLRHDGLAGDFLSSPALGSDETATVTEPPVRELIGTRIGPYKLVEPIGEGGMGMVYMAIQEHPVRRKVALKIIKPGLGSHQIVARFEAERQALAMMEHPNIARVLDAGETESGRPYFVMELVHGIPITEYCDRECLTIPDRLDLFLLVCQSVQHAHQKGIIHRDLKPSNVLVTLHDGVPVPKVIDFGIAKATDRSLTDKTLFTGFAQLIGTPLYMSPEQAELSGIDVDIRSDVYSLGVLLYELLTGTTPFDQGAIRNAALDEMRRIIREQDPPTPSARLGRTGDTRTAVSANRRSDVRTLGRSLRNELDWITMKALEKDRRRRYETAAAFADDIRRYRRNEPVEAGPPSAWYRLTRFGRRNRALLGTLALIVLVLATATSVSTWQMVLARRAREIADEATAVALRQRDVERRRSYVSDIRLAHQLIEGGRRAEARELLRRHLPASGEEDVRNFAWHYLMRICQVERQTLRGHRGAVYHARFTADGRTLVTCGKDGTVRFWDVATGRQVDVIEAHQDEVNWAAFSPDGRILATAGDDGTVKLWDAATHAEQAAIPAHEGNVVFVVFDPSGRSLVTAGRNDGMLKVWDRQTLRMTDGRRAVTVDLEGTVLSLDGEMLATAGHERYVKLWSAADLSREPTLIDEVAPGYAVALSNDGLRLASGDSEGNVRFRRLNAGRVVEEARGIGHSRAIQSIAFLPDNRVAVSGGDDASLRLWDSETGECLGTLLGHADKIWCVAVSPDGSTLSSTSSDGTCRLWESWPALLNMELSPVEGRAIGVVAFTPDSRTLSCVETVVLPTADGVPSAYLEFSGFDVGSGARRFRHRSARLDHFRVWSTLVTRDGGHAAAWSLEGLGTTWEVATGRSRAQAGSPASDSALPFTASAEGFICRVTDRRFELRDAATGRQLRVFQAPEPVLHVTYSPSGSLAAGLDTRLDLIIWDLVVNRVVARKEFKGTPPSTVLFSPDEKSLAVGTNSGAIHLLGPRTLDPIHAPLLGHTAPVTKLASSPDGTMLVSGATDGIVKFWDLDARDELITLARKAWSRVVDITFAHDGRTLAFWSEAGSGKPRLHVLPTALPE